MYRSKSHVSNYPSACGLVYFLIAGLSTFLPNKISGQASYPQSAYISTGEEIIFSQTTAQNEDINLSQTGPDLVWDFSQYQAQLQLTQECLPPSQTGYEPAFFLSCLLEGFPTLECLVLFNTFTNQAQTNDGANQLGPFFASELVRFQRKQDNVLEETMAGLLVETDTSSNQFVIIYDIPDTIYRFPIDYEDTLNSFSRIDLDFSELGVDIAVKSSQVRSYSVDSWGSLITPYATFENTLRVKMEIMREDTLIVGGIPTPISSNVILYQWLSPDHGLPVFQVTEQESLENIVLINYIDTVQCFDPAAFFNYSPQNIFIGENGMAPVTFFNNSVNADQFHWDFGDGSMSSVQNPLHNFTSAGVFEVALVACNNNCSPLLCDTSTVEINVQDTVSSVFNLGPVSSLKIYPNPGNQVISIDPFPPLGSVISIYALQGQLIARKSPDSVTGDIDISGIPAGAYTLVLIHDGKISAGRFMKME